MCIREGVGGADGEAEMEERARERMDEARTVEAVHLDHRVGVRRVVVDEDLRRDGEGIGAALPGRALRGRWR